MHANAFLRAEMRLDEGCTVLVETSGAVDVASLDPRTHRIMDLKCPGSGEVERNLWENLDHLTERDEVKFVVAERADYEWTRQAISEHGLGRRLEDRTLGARPVSPVWVAMDAAELAGRLLEDRLPCSRRTPLHKDL